MVSVFSTVVILILGFTDINNSGYSTTAAKMNAEDFFPNAKNNLTLITWAHAVNSKKLLSDAFNSSVMMLEADIVLGKIINGDDQVIPIMAHPPAKVSDLSLQSFLKEVNDFNDRVNSTNRKGIKLDFKTIEVFEASLSYISGIYPQITYPFWLNADILSGPLNASNTPVDARKFLNLSKAYSNAVLSLGWTTQYGNNTPPAVTYTQKQIQEMITTIGQNNVTQVITFPVRAGIAAESTEQLKHLISTTNKSTLTLWTSEYDPVNVEHLRELIFQIGIDRVYVDLPDKLKNKLYLDQVSAASKHTVFLCMLCIFMFLVSIL